MCDSITLDSIVSALRKTLINYYAFVFNFQALDKIIQQQLSKCAEVDEFRVKFFILRDAVNAEESQLKVNLNYTFSLLFFNETSPSDFDRVLMTESSIHYGKGEDYERYHDTKSDRRTLTKIDPQALEDIGEGCTMKDYEQLRLHNQGCTEKLEEKGAELEKLRTKALSAMQIFTEIREAAHVTEEDIESEKKVLMDVERALAEVNPIHSFETSSSSRACNRKHRQPGICFCSVCCLCDSFLKTKLNFEFIGPVSESGAVGV